MSLLKKIFRHDTRPDSTITDSIENRSLPSIPKENTGIQNELLEEKTLPNITEQDSINNITPHVVNSVFKNNQPNYNKSSEEVLYPFRPRRVINNNLKTEKFKDHEFLEWSENESCDSGLQYHIYLPKLQPEEIRLMQLIQSGDVASVESFLNSHCGININCTDYQGISPLYVAVQSNSEPMVEFLLRQPDIDIGDNVLHAIQSNCMQILEILLNAQKRISPGLEFAGTTHSYTFPEYITPLILASHLGHYEIVELLITRGHTITRPHSTRCRCVTCRNCFANNDTLYSSNARLARYKAISAPEYLVHVCSDPILYAFCLSAELRTNAATYMNLSAEYMQLRRALATFTVDLIGCCRTAEEVELILIQRDGTKGRRQFVLPRLFMAVEYGQKEFVAHPNTQHVLDTYWLGNWHSWRHQSSGNKMWIVIRRVMVLPFMVFMCVVAPWHPLVRHWQIPLNKLITHAAAYLVFLGLVFYISNQDKSAQKRGPPNTGAEGPVILYICGYTWSAFRMCVMYGPKCYFAQLWNWGEVIMLALFGLTMVFWAFSLDFNTEEKTERKYWNQYDPTLLSEGTFCLATILAYFRLMFLCKMNYHLGPLQVSLGKMIIDIYKYVIVFAIIISAFAAGLSRFYQYYDGMVYEDEFGMKTVQVSSFTSLTDTLKTLFWALFCMAPLESGDVILENTRNYDRGVNTADNKHNFTERIGYFCFGCFEVISVIVVLNMLIATMSNTFQKVTDNAAIEWTFGKTQLTHGGVCDRRAITAARQARARPLRAPRTASARRASLLLVDVHGPGCHCQMYINYMSQTTLPSPFNMIPTANGMGDILEWLRVKLCRIPGAKAKWSKGYCCYVEYEEEPRMKKEYPALMTALIQRYFREKSTKIKCTSLIDNEYLHKVDTI